MFDNVLESFVEMTHLLIQLLKRHNHCEILSLFRRDKIILSFHIIFDFLLFMFRIQLIIEHAFVVICSEARVDFSRFSMSNIVIDACFVFSKLTSNVRICVDVFSKCMKFLSSSFESIIKDFAIALDV